MMPKIWRSGWLRPNISTIDVWHKEMTLAVGNDDRLGGYYLEYEQLGVLCTEAIRSICILMVSDTYVRNFSITRTFSAMGWHLNTAISNPT
jgi:hypothetical protein